ncbi:MAG: hypothetical protein H8E46_06205 [FCB group bacterium]|nr:hypothetical protein [FCB group bacterium]
MKNIIFLLLAVFCVTISPHPASAQVMSLKLTGLKAEILSNYDDNILRYSDRDLDYFKNRTEINPSKLTTCDDSKNDFRLKFYIDGPQFFGNALKIRYFGKFSHFFNNSFKNYSSHTFILDQKISEKFSVDFKYFLLADFYLREYRDRDLNEYQSCTFDNHQARLGIDYRLTKNTAFTVQGQFDQIYYNQYFIEYDSENLSYFAVLNQRIHRDLRISFSAGFTAADNIGYVPIIPGIFDPLSEDDTEYGDGSYEEETYQAQIRWRLRKLLGKDAWFSLGYKLRHRIYTTDNLLEDDPFHAGRMDDRHRIVFSFDRNLLPRLEGNLTYTREWRETTSDYSTAEDVKSFTQNIIGFGLTYTIY